MTAVKDDVAELVTMVNSAYRGEASRKGWTTEADLLKGEMRTDVSSFLEMMEQPGAIFLKYISDSNAINGCVYLLKEKRGLYLGMLTVAPELQAAGIGKQLLAAAEIYAAENDCPVVFMSVISLRHELIAWYERHGYKKTGETKPMSADNRFGIPTQPLEFLIMEKFISSC